MKGLKSSRAIFLGKPHWCNFCSALRRSPSGRSSQRVFQQVLAEAPLLAFQRVRQGLERRLLAPRSTRPRRPLSNSASTASCNMRFSLRTITSGACNSISFFSRLLRLITRR